MHDLDAGRIFWKEWRAQRSFWLGLFGLAIVLEILVIVVLPVWGPTDPLVQLRIYQGLVIVLACSFATGSAAIAFAGEVEAKTKGLLQRIPVRPRDLLAGKLSLSLAGSYALLFALWLAGGLMLMQSTAASFSRVGARDVSHEMTTFLQFLLGPFVFVVVGGLFSLILSDVLLTVLVAGLSTAVFMAIPVIRDHLALQAAVIAIVGLCDFFLARRWLRDAGAVEWKLLPRITFPQVMVRPRQRVVDQAVPTESVRSAVAWRRGASSLIWKEFRQAFPFCLALLVFGLIALGLVSLAKLAYWSEGSGLIPLMLITIAPLLPGVAAIRAERKNGAFRLLANRGVAPDGLVICKHLVWLSLSLSVFAILLIIDRSLLANLSGPSRTPSLWGSAAGAAESMSESAATGFAAPLAVAAFHVVLLYALGFLLGLLLPGPIVAFFGGAIVWLGLAFCWMVVVGLRIPFWWTVGLFPVIFLAAAWARTSDWLIERSTPSAWGKVAAVFVVPFIGIFAATIVYRVAEIPAVVIPQAVLESGPAPGPVPGDGPAANAKPSLFVDALRALSGGPPLNRTGDDQRILSDGWQLATADEKVWVTLNAPARKLALEAAQRAPGSFPFQAATESDDRTAQFTKMQKIWSLAQLLLYSARELESEDRLEEALSCYIAVARLGRDTTRSGWLRLGFIGDNYSSIALNWMQRWAAHPKQSTERIKKAIREFETFESNATLLSGEILSDWRVERRALRKIIWGHSPTDKKNRTVSELWWTRWLLPWELVRLERLVDAIFAADLSEAESVQSELRNQGFVAMTAERVARWNRNQAVPWKYCRTTLDSPEMVQPFWGQERYVDRLATGRMDLIALAIAAETRGHQKLRESLRALVPTYFQRLPVDPWTGGEFLYEPQGFPVEIDLSRGNLAPGTPFLASAGMLDSRLVRLTHPADQTPYVEIVTRLGPPDKSRYRGAYPIFDGPVVRLP